MAHLKSGKESKTALNSGFYAVDFGFRVQWNPVDTVTNGPRKIGRINGVAIGGSFVTRKCMAVFVRRPKKVTVITR